MKKVFYKKLIRDNIPEVIESSGGVCETRILNNQEFETELRKKLVEESKEVLNSSKEELMGELADVLQLINSLVENNQLTMEDVQNEMKLKKEKRGGFDKKLFLEWASKKS